MLPEPFRTAGRTDDGISRCSGFELEISADAIEAAGIGKSGELNGADLLGLRFREAAR